MIFNNGLFIDEYSIDNIFNFIERVTDFENIRLVCRSWKKISENHIFWKKILNKNKLKLPTKKSIKYKNYYQCFIRNKIKFCIICKEEKKSNRLKICNKCLHIKIKKFKRKYLISKSKLIANY